MEDEFNVDELVRKIDAKIAELEKQSSEAEKKPPVAPPTQVSKGQQTPSILDSKSDMEPVLKSEARFTSKTANTNFWHSNGFSSRNLSTVYADI